MEKQTLQGAFSDFKASVQTLSLSTLDQNAKARASYAPFVDGKDGSLYVFVSRLAPHTQDLLLNAEVSILLLEDEKECRQIFARQRISYQCQAEIVKSDRQSYTTILDLMELRFGKVLELLRSLPDFVLFRFTPYEGQYVKGFGKAYRLVGDSLQELEHIIP